MTDPVLLDVTQAVATITLNRPDGMNSLTVAAKVALNEAVRTVAADPSVRALILTGSGRAFCVGQDLREHAALFHAGDSAPLSTVTEHYNPLVTMLSELPIPTIAALNGTAAGAGLGLACALDLRIAAAGSKFTTAFAGIGLTADSGLSWTLPRLIGAGRATALLLLAEPFTAEHALEMGMVNMVVPPEKVLDVATELAVRLASGPATAYGLLKQSVRFGASATLVETLAKEDELQTLAGRTSDHLGAVESFLAKTPPVFQGR